MTIELIVIKTMSQEAWSHNNDTAFLSSNLIDVSRTDTSSKSIPWNGTIITSRLFCLISFFWSSSWFSEFSGLFWSYVMFCEHSTSSSLLTTCNLLDIGLVCCLDKSKLESMLSLDCTRILKLFLKLTICLFWSW